MDNHEQIFFTKIELVIQNFIAKYGVDELVKWLNVYSKEISPTDYNTYHRIQKAVCETFQIPIADINSTYLSNWQYADAKRIISYLTYQRTKLKTENISNLQNCTQRNIYNQVRDVKHCVKNPKNFGRFMKYFNEITAKLDPPCPQTNSSDL